MAEVSVLLVLCLFCLFTAYIPLVESVIAPPLLPQRGTLSLDEVIILYFRLNLSYSLIVSFLSVCHGFDISLSTLKRRLRALELYRRRYGQLDLQRAVSMIKEELKCSGCLLGYRSMWRRLATQGITIPRNKVMCLLKLLNPQAAINRAIYRITRRVYRTKGPNFIWHVDSYDKLKTYGFTINGCIDGYSRRIMWLKVTSSACSAVVVKYYLDCIKKVQGCPVILRTDLGTENVRLSYLQPFLRRHNTDSLVHSSFIYGKSTSNQRIEAWWGVLRRWSMEWWIDMFKTMRKHGIFEDANVIHSDCLKFCFMDLLQKELDKIATEWNYHVIRKSRMAECPGGIPDQLYFLPQLQGVTDQKCDYDRDDVILAESHIDSEDLQSSFSTEFINLIEIIMYEDGLCMPATPLEAFDLFQYLTGSISNMM